MALQQHYSCCKQQFVFVLLLVIVGSCLLFATAAHQEVEVEQHQRYSKPRRLRDHSQLYQVIDDPNNTNKQRGLLNDVLDETSVLEFQQHKQQRRLKSEKIIKKVEKAVYSKEAKSDKASKVYARKSVKSKSEKVGKVEKSQFAKKFQKRGGSKSEKESKGQFAKKSFKRSKNEKEMNSKKTVGLKLKKARQAPSLDDTMEIMMSSMSMEFSMSM
ncbi:hypothetical protein FRACYDRAFT_268529 [Fragilariopsis cylindrus CCMP1102]|uniref:Uncharacterized protein n=1 Tax=Fragilariopsis cylindrus CCMP1102 TaxID=635003 RepID=A0A1E7FLH5_9STRA|nr:hypothetical protein FRACYDRAFT_268529 [Fragilariopsis cylindrus CCMP1102]|eukprot:OEU19012.1 hypothetical protein FRACYDRAFT_268529 [Fragilariopsis cylindrus CCMP1102]